MQNNTNDLDRIIHKSIYSRIKDKIINFKKEWKKGKYYILKNKEENIEKWKNNPKEMALGKLK